MPSISSRRFTFCTTVLVCHHLLWASCLLPNTKTSNPVSLQEIGFISALCKNESNQAVSGSFSQKNSLKTQIALSLFFFFE